MTTSNFNRRPDLELSTSVRAFELARLESALVDRQALARELSECLGNVANGDTDIVVLDLRGMQQDLDIELVTLLASNIAVGGRQLVCVVPPTLTERFGQAAFTAVSEPDQLYDWLTARGYRKSQSTPIPFFTFTQSELDELRTSGVDLGNVISDIETMRDSA